MVAEELHSGSGDTFKVLSGEPLGQGAAKRLCASTSVLHKHELLWGADLLFAAAAATRARPRRTREASSRCLGVRNDIVGCPDPPAEQLNTKQASSLNR